MPGPIRDGPSGVQHQGLKARARLIPTQLRFNPALKVEIKILKERHTKFEQKQFIVKKVDGQMRNLRRELNQTVKQCNTHNVVRKAPNVARKCEKCSRFPQKAKRAQIALRGYRTAPIMCLKVAMRGLQESRPSGRAQDDQSGRQLRSPCRQDEASAASTSKATLEEEACRICLLTEEEGNQPGSTLGSLETACSCRGSVGGMHAKCLDEWIAASGKDSCELCGSKFARNIRKL